MEMHEGASGTAGETYELGRTRAVNVNIYSVNNLKVKSIHWFPKEKNDRLVP